MMPNEVAMKPNDAQIGAMVEKSCRRALFIGKKVVNCTRFTAETIGCSFSF
jgi:hypothetical protein